MKNILERTLLPTAFIFIVCVVLAHEVEQDVYGDEVRGRESDNDGRIHIVIYSKYPMDLNVYYEGKGSGTFMVDI